MTFAEILAENAVIVDLKASSKKALLKELGREAEKLTGIDHRLIYDRILERERLGSTGVGAGVAIPHGKFAGLSKIFGLFVKLETPIDYDALDDQAVDLVFLLLSPEEVSSDHLQALSLVSRLLRDGEFCQKIRQATQSRVVYSLLNNAVTMQPTN